MEHIKKFWSLYLIGLVAIIIVLNRNKLFGSSAPKDGDSCVTKDSFGLQIAGIYKNGICIPSQAGPGGSGGNGTNETQQI